MTPAEELRAAAERVRDEPELVGGRAIAEPLATMLEEAADFIGPSDFCTPEVALARATLATAPTPSPTGSNPGGER